MMAIRMLLDVKILNVQKDIKTFILKYWIVEEMITIDCIYDYNTGTDRTLCKIEELLRTLDIRQGILIGRDYNVITVN